MEGLSRFLLDISSRLIGSEGKFLMCNDAKKKSIQQLIDKGALNIEAGLPDEAI